jgi:hypothetical protein
MNWEDLLLEAGVELDGRLAERGRAELTLQTPFGAWTVEVKRYARSPRPHELATVIAHAQSNDHPLLLLAPELSDTTRKMLVDAGISHITRRDGILSLGGRTFALGDQDPPSPDPGASPAPEPHIELPWRGRSAFQVLRRLLQYDTTPTQTVLATEAEVSQPRVSQVLATLAEHDLLGRDRHVPSTHRNALIDYWIDRYPGPGGVTTRWYSSLPLNEAVATAATVAHEADARPVLSNGLAADHLAPFARPTHATLYVRQLVDLGVAQMVRTPEPGVAAIEVVVPEDPTVWRQDPDPPHAELSGARVPIADTLQIAWDLARVGGLDAGKQVDRLLERTLRRAVEPA